MGSVALLLYRIAWEPALLLVRALAAVEKIAGGKLWPTRWQLTERLNGVEKRGNLYVTHLLKPGIWMHAASLGECKGLWAVAQALAEDKALTFVLTSNTVDGKTFLSNKIRATGMEARVQARLAPLDHPREVRRFLRHDNIGALVLFEMELWPHFIGETKRAQKPVLWISALLNARAARRFKPVLQQIDWVLTQEDGGDLRGLHYLEEYRAHPRPAATRAGIALVSIHADELGAITPALQAVHGDYPLFVFPRKMESLPAFRAALEPLGFELRSTNSRAARQIVDAFGLVGETLSQCRVAVIGGSFAPHGGHNLWEPLTAGVSMVIGPWHESQQYLVGKLTAANLLSVVTSVPDLDRLHDSFTKAPPEGLSRLFIKKEQSLLNVSLEMLRKRLAAMAK